MKYFVILLIFSSIIPVVVSDAFDLRWNQCMETMGPEIGVTENEN